MLQAVNMVRQLLDECSDGDRREWKSHTQTILEAITTSHPAERAVHTAIAAGFLNNVVLSRMRERGWTHKAVRLHKTHFIVVEANETVVRVMVTILQWEKGKLRHTVSPQGDLYQARIPASLMGPRHSRLKSCTADPKRQKKPLRALSFTEFDILAVSMQPLTRRWSDFRYALSRMLAPHKDSAESISPVQWLPSTTSHSWTSDFNICLSWHLQALAKKTLPLEMTHTSASG